jgi:hypothetical protein
LFVATALIWKHFGGTLTGGAVRFNDAEKIGGVPVAVLVSSVAGGTDGIEHVNVTLLKLLSWTPLTTTEAIPDGSVA